MQQCEDQLAAACGPSGDGLADEFLAWLKLADAEHRRWVQALEERPVLAHLYAGLVKKWWAEVKTAQVRS